MTTNQLPAGIRDESTLRLYARETASVWKRTYGVDERVKACLFVRSQSRKQVTCLAVWNVWNAMPVPMLMLFPV